MKYLHYNVEQSRRDDIEGIMYVFIYLVNGELPWQGLKAKDKNTLIMESKMSIPESVLCQGLPSELVDMMIYVRGIEFDEKPDYEMLRGSSKMHLTRSTPIRRLRSSLIGNLEERKNLMRRKKSKM